MNCLWRVKRTFLFNDISLLKFSVPTPCNQVLRINVVISLPTHTTQLHVRNPDARGVSLHRRSLGEHKRTCSQQQKKRAGEGRRWTKEAKGTNEKVKICRHHACNWHYATSGSRAHKRPGATLRSRRYWASRHSEPWPPGHSQSLAEPWQGLTHRLVDSSPSIAAKATTCFTSALIGKSRWCEASCARAQRAHDLLTSLHETCATLAVRAFSCVLWKSARVRNKPWLFAKPVKEVVVGWGGMSSVVAWEGNLSAGNNVWLVWLTGRSRPAGCLPLVHQ